MKFFLTSLSFLLLMPGFTGAEPDSKEIFGDKFPSLDHMSTGEWWTRTKPVDTAAKKKGKAPKQIIEMNVPRDQVVAVCPIHRGCGDTETHRPVVSPHAERIQRSTT
jgi:hypothetical protein